MRLALPLLLLGAFALAAPAARAQDVSADPTYGTVRLEAGFLPDPHENKLTAGGSIRVNRGSCTYGNVADAPDVDFYYTGNGSNDLYLYTRAGSDTTLLINTPNGSWVCDDDGLGERNPLVVIPDAASGLYNIWVGTYSDGMAPATLYLSEVDPR